MAQKFLTNVDLNGNELQNVVLQVLASNPGSPTEGRIFYHSGEDTIKVYSGSAWRSLVASLVAGGSYTDAISISTSNGEVTLTLNLADTDSAGLLSSTFWNLLNGATSDATGSTLAKRDSNSQIKVAATPTDNAHAASKGYVDSAISGATVSAEQVQDIVGAQIATNGSHSGITASYDDAGDGAIDLSLDSSYSPTFAGMTLNGNLVFEGATADAYETTVTVVDPTADRTITLPNATDTLVGKATTDTFTNKTFDTAGTGNSFSVNGNAITSYVGSGNNVVLSTNPTISGLYVTSTLGIESGASIVFEGSTADAYETTLTVTDPTADRTITIPDATGTVALLGTIALGADTTGNYIADVNAGTGVSVTHTPGEGSSPTIAIGQAVGTTDSPTFAGLTINGASIVFEGATADAYETTVTVTDPTADRTITVPDASGTVITTGNLSDITSVGTLSSLTISGNLTVNGTTTTINSTTVTVDDKNLELGSTASPSDATADGGGITLKGTTDKTFSWVDATDAWTSSEHIDLATGKSFYINGTQVLSGSTLGSGVTSSSLTSLGTITTGVWNGTDIAVADGGTGASTAANARTNLASAAGEASGRTTSTPALARVAKQGCAASSSGTSTTTVTHNFNTTDVQVQVYEVSTGATVIGDVTRTNSNTVSVVLLGTITANDYTIVVVG